MSLLSYISGFLSIAVAITIAIICLLRYRANLNRSLNMVFLRIVIPKGESKEDRERDSEAFSTGKDFKEIVGIMTHFFDSLHSIFITDWRRHFFGQEFLSFEYVVEKEMVNFYCVVPRHLAERIEKQITAFYPMTYVERVPDYNIFKAYSKAAGCYIRLVRSPMYPIKTYQHTNSDPLNSILNGLSKLTPDEGAAIQIMVRPYKDGWQKKGRKAASKIFTTNKEEHFLEKLNPLKGLGSLLDIAVHGPNEKNM
ncbi:hypothetical protein HZA41_02195, partial [Candidatus Peregrinibacteria bacterium]|nr:hypothetical protein [Candidatus Peregrinibacteria bacterium]